MISSGIDVGIQSVFPASPVGGCLAEGQSCRRTLAVGLGRQHPAPAVPDAPGELRESQVHSHMSATVFPQAVLGPVKQHFLKELYEKTCSSVFISTLVWLSASLEGS